MEVFTDWLKTGGVSIGIIVGVIWIGRKFGNVFIERAIRRSIKGDKYVSKGEEKKREDTLIGIVQATMRVMLWTVGSLLIIQELGVNIGPLLAGVSVVGVALGFGAQSLVKDFVSGMFIIMENQYRVGDVVRLAGESGVVESITMRETVLRNLQGEVIHIPNGSIDVAINKTMGFSNIVMDIGVSYDSDIEKVEKIVNKVAKELAGDEAWQGDILEPINFQRVESFGASEVVVRAMGKVKPGKQWTVAGEFRKRIKTAFDENDIEIPFPQRVVHTAKN